MHYDEDRAEPFTILCPVCGERHGQRWRGGADGGFMWSCGGKFFDPDLTTAESTHKQRLPLSTGQGLALRGCICPPTSEQTCQADACPRKPSKLSEALAKQEPR